MHVNRCNLQPPKALLISYARFLKPNQGLSMASLSGSFRWLLSRELTMSETFCRKVRV